MFLFTSLFALAFASPSLPFEADVGGVTGTTKCPAQYASKECDTQFVAVGEKESLKVLHYVYDRAISGVAAYPSKTPGAINGIRQSFGVTSGMNLSISTELTPVGGLKASTAVQLVFKDAKGKVVATRNDRFFLKGETTIEVDEIVPKSATMVDVTIGADDQDGVDDSTAGEFLIIGWLIISDAHAPTGECDEADCDGQSCDISCTGDTMLVSSCVSMGPPSCSAELSCYCADKSDEFSTPMRVQSWY